MDIKWRRKQPMTPASSKLPDFYNSHGILTGVPLASASELRDASLRFSYEERAQIALSVAFIYSGGDYFEFGCEGMATFRNFLSAFYLHGRHVALPDTRFYAFDFFGVMEGITHDREYFQSWSDPNRNQLKETQSYINQHGIFADQCRIVAGLFENTLTDNFKSGFLSENRRVGFAFLDCNIWSSYKTVLEWLPELMRDHSFIYMDEYFSTDGVPMLFDDFCSALAKRGLRAFYIQAAAATGALFRIAPVSAS